MADTYQLKREIAWHTEEVRRKERELDVAKHAIPELKRKSEQAIREAERKEKELARALEDIKRKLEQHTRDLARIEAANDNDEIAASKKRRAA